MHVMDLSIAPVLFCEKGTLKNLLEKYSYEFSQYDNRGVDDSGLHGYSNLDLYWTEMGRHAFFIKASNKLAGFTMVHNCPIANLKTDYTMAEFFVIHKYRNMGVGAFAAKSTFDKFRGQWGLMYHPKNFISKNFWNKVVYEYTHGKYLLVDSNSDAKYADGTVSEILVFSS